MSSITVTRMEFDDPFSSEPNDVVRPQKVDYVIDESPDTLMLRCRSCQENWCDHIHEAIEQNLDAESMWETHFDWHPGDDISFPVPVTPTIKQWTDVTLEATESVDQYRVQVEPEVQWAPLGIDNLSPGYLSRGEGRFILREMTMQWFAGTIQLYDLQKVLNCKNPTHSYAANEQWFKDMESKHVVPQLWSVFITSKCLVCAGLDRFRTQPGSGAGVIPGPENRTYSDLVPRG